MKKRYLLKKLITESFKKYIKEIEDEDEDPSQETPKDPNDNQPEIDPDVEGDPYGEDDIWPGSDIAGVKKGGTGFAHGQGYVGWDNRRRSKLTRRDLDKILFIDYIDGVSEEELEKFSKLAKESTYNFINKNMPWVFNYHNYGSKWEYPRTPEPIYPFANSFNNEVSDDWLSYFEQKVYSELNFYTHWTTFPTEKLKNSARSNSHWIARFKTARDIAKRYPTFKEDLTELLQFLSKLNDAINPTKAQNPEAYPAFVTFYDMTQHLGGHEEGGWWYDDYEVIDSVQVNSYKDARKAAVRFLKMIKFGDLNGKPRIVLEKESGSKANQPPPEYS